MTNEQTRTDAQIETLLHFSGPSECIDPSSIDEADLISFCQRRLADAAPIEAHLESCTYCQVRAQEYRALGSGKFKVWLAGIGALVVAAVILLWGAWPAPPAELYEIGALRGTLRATMGADPQRRGPVAKFGRNALVEAVIRPRKLIDGAPSSEFAMRVFVENGKGEVRLAPAGISKLSDEAWPVFELRARGSELFWAGSGPYVLRFAVGDPGSLQRLSASLQTGENPVFSDVQVLDVRCEYHSGSP